MTCKVYREREKMMKNLNEVNREEAGSSKEELSELERNFYLKAPEILGENWEKDYASLLMCTFKERTGEEKRKMQEAHNAGHALTFFTFALNSSIEGTAGGNVQLRAFKTMGHLFCLREFILPTEKKKRAVINRLFEAVRREFPDTKKKWTAFLVAYWREISVFAYYYKHHACFPKTSYEKICDIVNGRELMTTWWWKLKVAKVIRKNVRLKQIISLFNTRKQVIEMKQKANVYPRFGKRIKCYYRWVRLYMRKVRMTEREIGGKLAPC